MLKSSNKTRPACSRVVGYDTGLALSWVVQDPLLDVTWGQSSPVKKKCLSDLSSHHRKQLWGCGCPRSHGNRHKQTKPSPATAAGWDKDGCRGAENKSRADAQQPDKQRGQEGTDKGFHYLKGRKRDTWRTSRNTNHREKIHTSTQMHCKPKGGGLKLLRSKKHLTQEFLERTQKKTNRWGIEGQRGNRVFFQKQHVTLCPKSLVCPGNSHRWHSLKPTYPGHSRVEAHRKSSHNLTWELNFEQQTLGPHKDPNFLKRPECFYPYFDVGLSRSLFLPNPHLLQ